MINLGPTINENKKQAGSTLNDNGPTLCGNGPRNNDPGPTLIENKVQGSI